MDTLTPADLPADTAAGLQWLLPGQAVDPVASLQRIRWMCEQFPDLHNAMLSVVATHQGIARPQLAAALQRFRPDLHALPQQDVLGLVNGLLNGGRDGFDAVLRTRKSSERRSGAMPFVRPD